MYYLQIKQSKSYVKSSVELFKGVFRKLFFLSEKYCWSFVNTTSSFVVGTALVLRTSFSGKLKFHWTKVILSYDFFFQGFIYSPYN